MTGRQKLQVYVDVFLQFVVGGYKSFQEKFSEPSVNALTANSVRALSLSGLRSSSIMDIGVKVADWENMVLLLYADPGPVIFVTWALTAPTL